MTDEKVFIRAEALPVWETHVARVVEQQGQMAFRCSDYVMEIHNPEPMRGDIITSTVIETPISHFVARKGNVSWEIWFLQIGEVVYARQNNGPAPLLNWGPIDGSEWLIIPDFKDGVIETVEAA